MTTLARNVHVHVGGGAFLVVFLLSALAFSPAPSRAEVSDSDILHDSVLELAEVSTGGSYRTLSVSLEAREGQATLTARKDGVKSEAQLSTEEALALWKTVLAAGIESLSDTPAAGAPADQSRFTVSFRAGTAANSFTVYGVDSVADTRYRDIVREILHVTDARIYGKHWRK